MAAIEFERRAFLFFDILGFRNLIRSGRRDEIAQIFYANDDGLMWLRNREQIERGTKFECNAFSDNLVASDLITNEALFKVIDYACYMQNKFLWRGIFSRGGMVIDEVHHSPKVVIGEALIRAYELESRNLQDGGAYYPRILVSPEVHQRYEEYCALNKIRKFRKIEEFRIIKDQHGDYVINPFHYTPDEPPFVKGEGTRRALALDPLIAIITKEIREPRNLGFEERLKYVLDLAATIRNDPYFDDHIISRLTFTDRGPVTEYIQMWNAADLIS